MSDAPGRWMAAEIAEQPAVWSRLLDDTAEIDEVAAVVAAAAPRFVLLAARGTSDHAALYAKYLLEIQHGLPVGMVSPSTTTVYGARPDLRDVLLIAVSQSGGSPDLTRTVESARAGGALTVALTNAPGSPLAGAAAHHVDIRAGQERAVAATKSYTSELLALHLLLAAVDGRSATAARELPGLGAQVLEDGPAVAALAQRYRFADRLVTTGRGYAYPTAREAALKLMETCYVGAQAFSGADLLHGPLAMIDRNVPVLAVVPEGPGGEAMHEPLARLRERGADVLGIGAADAVAGCSSGIVLPGDVPDDLSPLLQILPAQQLALHLALARGEDPDAPRGLSKVTETS